MFEMLGGVERMAHEFGRNPEAYREFVTKVWVKGVPRVSSSEHVLGGGVEDLLDRLEEEDRKDREKQIELAEVSPGVYAEVVEADDEIT